MYKEELEDLKVEKIHTSNYVKDPEPIQEEKPLVYLYNTRFISYILLGIHGILS